MKETYQFNEQFFKSSISFESFKTQNTTLICTDESA